MVASAAATAKERAGGGGPGAAAGGGGGGGASESGVQRDVHGNYSAYDSEKPWFVQGVYEFHHLIRQSDLGGDGPNKNFNFLYFDAGWDFSKEDRVYGRVGFYQRYIADSNESGLRFDDAFIAYQRKIFLPEEFVLRVLPRFSIPLSYESHVQRLVTAPRLTVALDKTLGLASFEALVYGEAYINGSTSGSNAATPNPRSVIAMLLEAEVAMPFHKALSVGIEGYLASIRYYDPAGGSLDGTGLTSATGGVNPGTTADPNYGSGQPSQASYGGELYARYLLPPIQHVLGDVRLAYANGDSTLGYQNMRHDGVTRVNLFYRHVGEIYLALTARY
ncbi:MAG: hypothetical protein ACXWP4_11290 [Polyangiales bacterium]